MGIKKEQRYCASEDRLVLAEKNTPNHFLHLVLTVLTGGLWLIVWFCLAAVNRPYRCPNCGEKTEGVWLYRKLEKRKKRDAIRAARIASKTNKSPA